MLPYPEPLAAAPTVSPFLDEVPGLPPVVGVPLLYRLDDDAPENTNDPTPIVLIGHWVFTFVSPAPPEYIEVLGEVVF